MASHAACSPSSASMWMACPASVTKTKDVIRPSSKFAREGTAAHAVAEMILKGDVFLPDKVTVENEEFIVSPGMCRALNPYVHHVQGFMALKARVYLEQHIKVPFTDNMVWGTLDCGAHLPNGELHVVDLKFGKGVAVDPLGPQLKFYALGLAAITRTHEWDTRITLTICQPRVEGGPFRTHSTTLRELVEWKDRYVYPALDRIKSGDETEIVGSHCRWCVRKAECTAFNARHQGHAASVFEDISDAKNP